jgi:hypothetical protein
MALSSFLVLINETITTTEKNSSRLCMKLPSRVPGLKSTAFKFEAVNRGYFGQLIENYRNNPHFGATYFFHSLIFATFFDTKWVWAVFWATFSKNSSLHSACHYKYWRGLWHKSVSVLVQGCQMAYFQTKTLDLGKFWLVLQWKYFIWPFGLFYSYFVYFVAIWYIVCMCYFVYFPRFGMLYQEKSGNPVLVKKRKWDVRERNEYPRTH